MPGTLCNIRDDMVTAVIDYGTLHANVTNSVVPENVIYNDPATIVEWSDGSKTVVKCDPEDSYDEREGFLLCCAKKLMGNTGAYNDYMRDVPRHQVKAMAWIGR